MVDHHQTVDSVHFQLIDCDNAPEAHNCTHLQRFLPQFLNLFRHSYECCLSQNSDLKTLIFYYVHFFDDKNSLNCIDPNSKSYFIFAPPHFIKLSFYLLQNGYCFPNDKFI